MPVDNCENPIIFFESTCQRTRGLVPIEDLLCHNGVAYKLCLVVGQNTSTFFRYKHCDKWWLLKLDRFHPTDKKDILQLLPRYQWKQ